MQEDTQKKVAQIVRKLDEYEKQKEDIQEGITDTLKNAEEMYGLDKTAIRAAAKLKKRHRKYGEQAVNEHDEKVGIYCHAAGLPVQRDMFADQASGDEPANDQAVPATAAE